MKKIEAADSIQGNTVNPSGRVSNDAMESSDFIASFEYWRPENGLCTFVALLNLLCPYLRNAAILLDSTAMPLPIMCTWVMRICV